MAESDGRVVSNFIVQALRGQVLALYGEGTQTRSFCNVDDLVDGLIRLMNADRTARPGESGDSRRVLYQAIGGNDQPTVWRTALGGIQTAPTRRSHPATARHQQAERLLGWRPTIALKVLDLYDYGPRLLLLNEAGDWPNTLPQV